MSRHAVEASRLSSPEVKIAEGFVAAASRAISLILPRRRLLAFDYHFAADGAAPDAALSYRRLPSISPLLAEGHSF